MDSEIERLTVIINLYKDKLTRRESENRNLLVELKLYKDKVESIRQDFIDEITQLRQELETKNKEYIAMKGEYQTRIHSL